MPTFRNIVCQLEYSDGLPFDEVEVEYIDNHVETWVEFPFGCMSLPFRIRISSAGFISRALAVFVYKNGEYQYNRRRHDLVNPEETEKLGGGEINIVIRNDGLVKRPSASDRESDSQEEAYSRREHRIEVSVLRCHAVGKQELPRSRSSNQKSDPSMDDSDSNSDSSSQDGNEEKYMMSGALLDGTSNTRPREESKSKASSSRKESTTQKTSSTALRGGGDFDSDWAAQSDVQNPFEEESQSTSTPLDQVWASQGESGDPSNSEHQGGSYSPSDGHWNLAASASKDNKSDVENVWLDDGTWRSATLSTAPTDRDLHDTKSSDNLDGHEQNERSTGHLSGGLFDEISAKNGQGAANSPLGASSTNLDASNDPLDDWEQGTNAEASKDADERQKIWHQSDETASNETPAEHALNQWPSTMGDHGVTDIGHDKSEPFQNDQSHSHADSEAVIPDVTTGLSDAVDSHESPSSPKDELAMDGTSSLNKAHLDPEDSDELERPMPGAWSPPLMGHSRVAKVERRRKSKRSTPYMADPDQDDVPYSESRPGQGTKDKVKRQRMENGQDGDSETEPSSTPDTTATATASPRPSRAEGCFFKRNRALYIDTHERPYAAFIFHCREEFFDDEDSDDFGSSAQDTNQSKSDEWPDQPGEEPQTCEAYESGNSWPEQSYEGPQATEGYESGSDWPDRPAEEAQTTEAFESGDSWAEQSNDDPPIIEANDSGNPWGRDTDTGRAQTQDHAWPSDNDIDHRSSAKKGKQKVVSWADENKIDNSNKYVGSSTRAKHNNRGAGRWGSSDNTTSHNTDSSTNEGNQDPDGPW